jgi:CheY-like chemotaxis protein
MTRRVLSVGQCVPDHASLVRFLQSHFDVEIVPAETGPDALDALRKGPFDLVLVNRKLDVDYSDGADVLRAIKSDPELAGTPVMLVSNYREHQDNAVAAGAEYGFGKLEYQSPDVVRRLEKFLA